MQHIDKIQPESGRRIFLKKAMAAGTFTALGGGLLGMSGSATVRETGDLPRKRTGKGLPSFETPDRLQGMPIRFLPIKREKLLFKLDAARRAGMENAITFEFSHFMSPNSSYTQAGHLYNRYCETLLPGNNH